MSYHNTNKESGDVLAASEKKAQSQEEEVMHYVRSLPFGAKFTAEEVWIAIFKDRNVPITSARRAVTNLEKAGHLIRTNEMRMGSMGKMIHCWTIGISIGCFEDLIEMKKQIENH